LSRNDTDEKEEWSDLNPSDIFDLDGPGLAINPKEDTFSILSCSVTNFRVFTSYDETDRCSEVLEFYAEDITYIIKKYDKIEIKVWEAEIHNGRKLP
jgi:hypothetical protein